MKIRGVISKILWSFSYVFSIKLHSMCYFKTIT